MAGEVAVTLWPSLDGSGLFPERAVFDQFFADHFDGAAPDPLDRLLLQWGQATNFHIDTNPPSPAQIRKWKVIDF